MKRILIPTDLSDNAQNALRFAIELAKRTGARLDVLYASLEKNKEENTKKLEDVKKMLENSSENYKYQIYIENLSFLDAMTKMLKEKPDIIVMGTKGAGGLKEIFIGSNTVKVINNINCPVLAIPESAGFDQFVNQGKNLVVYASDFTPLKNDDALNILKEIAMLIVDCEVKIVGVRAENTKLSPIKRMERNSINHFFGNDVKHSIITVFSNGVIKGLNYYINQKNNVGIVAVVNKREHSFFTRHITSEIASHTSYPLLVLQE